MGSLSTGVARRDPGGAGVGTGPGQRENPRGGGAGHRRRSAEKRGDEGGGGRERTAESGGKVRGCCPRAAGSQVPGASRSSSRRSLPHRRFWGPALPPPPPRPARSRATGCSLRAAAARPAPAAGGQTREHRSAYKDAAPQPSGSFWSGATGVAGGDRERRGAPAALHGQGL